MKRSRLLVGLAAISLTALAAGTQTAFAASSNSTQTLAGDTPTWVTHATKVGPTDSSQSLDLTVWLKLRSQSNLDKVLHDQYTKGSGSYHQWLSQAQFDAAYSPTSQQVKSTSNFLSAHGLSVESVADNNFYVNVSGTVAQAEKAFHVQINDYRYRGKSYRSNAADPSVATDGGGAIADVTGLDDAGVFQPLSRHSGPGKAPASTPVANPWKGLCGGFDTTNTVAYTDGSSQEMKGFIPCDGYTGAELQKAYGVDQLGGIDGAGQTVAIVDAYGSPTILQDANKFAQESGLPALDSSNFQVVSPKGVANKKESKAQDPVGWQPEVTLDVDAVHSMAPGAKIVLVAAPNNYASLDEADNWVVVHHLANIVTNSWGLTSDLMSPGQGSRDERIFEEAAAEGIGMNFSSGDNGDETVATGTKSVDFPASSPWVNAVGGTSLFLNSDGSYDVETGWGTWFDELATCATSSPVSGTVVAGTTDTPQKQCDTYAKTKPFPEDLGFQFGAGGGLSSFYSAQPWQSTAIGGDSAAGFGPVGTHRAVPDISMLADPYTGMAIWLTDEAAGDTSPVEETYGGTSLASPLFAGIMADVDQARAAKGLGPAGLASQYEYGLSSPAVHDVLSPNDGIGNPGLADGPHAGDAMSLFYGSFHSGSLFQVGFNQDTSLDTATGWDDVTGVGTPYAPDLVTALSSP